MENPKRSVSKNNYNHLKNEKSPYLIQHAKNPVDWYPWGEEAFRKAEIEDKPIFLSIGYSTCHWCHVMEKESFEDQEVAELMNKVFVAIKVDREERPDIDGIYMTASQIMTGTGGWPLTIIMTPDKKPFFAGTYFPKESGFGSIGIKDMILNVHDIWVGNRDEVLNSGDQILNALKDVSKTRSGTEFDINILEKTYDELSKIFDDENGGFGEFQKFPTPHNLMFLLRYYKRTGNKHSLHMVKKTLDSMRSGGIYDHIGFGIHRYSVDKYWLVPHFEKMLYDQALVAMVYTEAYQVTGDPNYRKTAEEIFTYILRDMKSPKGAFFSAEDADSEGVEGKFYQWTAEEITGVLDDEDAELAMMLYNIKESGNFNDGYSHNSNKNIPYLLYSVEKLADKIGADPEDIEDKIEDIRSKLYIEREKRVHPHKDDKILTDWNGLIIAALAKAGSVFKNKEYCDGATEAADFILDKLTDNGRLIHRYRDDQASVAGNLDDYSFIIWGLLEVYSSVFDVKYLNAAIELNNSVIKHFWDEENYGFFFTADDAEKVLIREKKTYDNATPSGNSVELLNLIKIARLTDNPEMESLTVKMEKAFSEEVKRIPAGHTMFIVGVDFKLGPSFEVVVVGNPESEDTVKMIDSLNKPFIPNMVTILKDPETSDELDNINESLTLKKTIEGKSTAYVCASGSCKIPTTSVEEMLRLMDEKI